MTAPPHAAAFGVRRDQSPIREVEVPFWVIVLHVRNLERAFRQDGSARIIVLTHYIENATDLERDRNPGVLREGRHRLLIDLDVHHAPRYADPSATIRQPSLFG